MRSEIIRQAALLDQGRRIKQETRHFSETTGDTRPGRSKEEATDYRYFPEPDLVPVAPDAAWIEEIRAGLPELPAARRARARALLGVDGDDLRQMTNAGVVDLVGATVEAGRAGRRGAQLVAGLPGAEGQRTRDRAVRAGRSRPRRWPA